MKLLPPIEDRAEWLEWRRQGLGASDIAGIMGLSPWSSPLSVWASKKTEQSDDGATYAMRFGQVAEEAIANLFEEDNDVKVTDRQALAIGEHPWMRATIDGRIDKHTLVEIKTDSKSAKWDDVPVHYQTQAAWQCICTGASKVIFVVLHMRFATDLAVYEYVPDVLDTQAVISAASSFWERYIEGDDVPPADGLDATTEALKHAWKVEHDAANASNEALAAHAELVDIKGRMKADSERKALLENVIKVELGATADLLGPDGTPLATWRESNTTRLDTKALAKDHPTLAAKYTSKQPVRRFLVKQPKEN